MHVSLSPTGDGSIPVRTHFRGCVFTHTHTHLNILDCTCASVNSTCMATVCHMVFSLNHVGSRQILQRSFDALSKKLYTLYAYQTVPNLYRKCYLPGARTYLWKLSFPDILTGTIRHWGPIGRWRPQMVAELVVGTQDHSSRMVRTPGPMGMNHGGADRGWNTHIRHPLRE